MSTIVLRNTKGSALTFAEGDANFTNLNNDKIEDITGENIGDLSDVNIAGSAASGSVSDIDAVRNPNTITLDGAAAAGVVYNSRIRFTGVDISGSGLSVDTDYYIAADTGNDAFEISNAQDGSPISITDTSVYGDFDWSAPDVTSGGITDGQTLVWDNANSRFNAGDASSVSDLNDLGDVDAPAPSDGNILVYNTSSGNWFAQAPSGGSAPSIALIDPNFSVISNGKIQIAMDIDPDGFIGSISSDTFNLDAGDYLIEIIGRIRNNADFSISLTIPGVTSYTLGYPMPGNDAKSYMYSLGRFITLGSNSTVGFYVAGATSGYSAGDTLFRITKF